MSKKSRNRKVEPFVDYPHSFPLVGERHAWRKKLARATLRKGQVLNPEDIAKANAKAAATAKDIQQMELLKLGFPADYWLPAHLAGKWRTDNFPTTDTPQAVEQWQTLSREAASLAAVGGLGNAKDIKADLAHDLKLLCRYRKSMAASHSVPRHSADFTSVHWFGRDYRFTKGLQAECVRFLFEAWTNGTPSLSEKTIGEKAGSGSDRFRLAHVFNPTKKQTGKREPHPAWTTMISTVGKGMFALKEP